MHNTVFLSSRALRSRPGLAPAVDPRTGQLLYSLHIAHLIGNYHMGPDFSLELNFRPGSISSQFGKGFYPNLTRFDTENMALTMRDGAVFFVKEQEGNQSSQYEGSFSFVHDNPHHFKFSKVKQNYYVYHKDGTVEMLSGTGKIKYVSNIYSPLGHELEFSWVDNKGAMFLKSISDKNQKLVNVNHYDNSIDFIIFPESTSTFTVTLRLEKNRIIEVSRDPIDKTLFQNIEYCDSFRSPYYAELNKVDQDAIWMISNTFGVHDVFLYDFSAHLDHNSYRVAYIKQHTHKEFVDEQELTCIKHYAFSETNFLGLNGISNTRRGKNEDCLYDVSYNMQYTPYRYHSTETWSLDFPVENGTTSGVSHTTRKYSVKRVYNNYHLLLEEDIKIEEPGQQGGNVETVTKNSSFEYLIDYHKLYDGQKNNFDKVNKTTVKYSHSKNKSEKILTELFSYDEQGNIIAVADSSGNEKEIEYYPASGVLDKCPADIHGFINHIKNINSGKRSIEYKYGSIGSAHPDSKNGQATVCINEIFKNDGVITHEIENKFGTQRGTFAYGRVVQKSVTYPLSEFKPLKVVDQIWSNTIVDGREIIICEKHYDRTSKVAFKKTKAWYVPDYRVAFDVDTNNDKKIYTYTSVGHIKTVTLSEGSLLKKSMNYKYRLDVGRLSVELSTQEQEAKTYRYYDSNGRLAEAWLQSPSFAKLVLIYKCVRNINGKKTKEYKYDYKPNGEILIEERKEYFYNIWGMLEKIRNNDGITKCYHCDPISERIWSYLSWIKDDGQIAKNAINFMQYKDGRIFLYGRSIDEKLSDNYDTTLVRYDKYGRIEGLTSQNGIKPVTITYNDLGQINSCETTYGCKINYHYVVGMKNASELKVVSGKLENTIMRCTYDPWGRINHSQGNEYHYNGTGVSEINYDNKNIISFKYDQVLNKVSEISTGSPPRIRTYQYNNSGMITSINEKDSGKFYEFVYDELSNLKHESSNYTNATVNTSFTRSVCGRIIKKEDVSGNQIEYHYDILGRVSQVDYNDMAIAITYDKVGQVSQKKMVIKDKREVLIQNYEYDSFGRCTRISVDAVGDKLNKSHAVQYTYNKKDKLVQRLFVRGGGTLREESYDYDENGRLQAFLCKYSQPKNADGHRVLSQHAVWDGLSRLLSFTGNTDKDLKVERNFSYNNPAHPLRVSTIKEISGGREYSRDIAYDTMGRVIADGFGYAYSYDSLGRLNSSHSEKEGMAIYEYDCRDRLVKITNGSYFRQYIYQGGVLAQIITDKEVVTYFDYRVGYKIYNKNTKKTRYITRATDSRGDTLFLVDIINDSEMNIVDYLPWRDTLGTGSYVSLLANEYYDKFSDCYICGNGLRYYNPRLKQFLTPDILSPLKGNYINTYSYCNGDPVNLHDTTGTLSLNAWGNILLGGAVIAGTLLTEGGAGVASAIVRNMTLISGATAMASGLLEHADPHLSTQLQMASLGFGAVGLAADVTKFALSLVKNDEAIEWAIYKMQGPSPSASEIKNAHASTLYNNFMGKGILAYQVHSAPSIPYLSSFTGELIPARLVAEHEIIPLLQQAISDRNIYTHPDTPLLLVACAAGSSGAALEVANVIRRPVAAFLQGIWSYSGETAEQLAYLPHSVGNYPVYKTTGKGRKIYNWLRGIPNCIVAPYHIYYPDDFFNGTHDINAVLDFNQQYLA